MQSFQINRPSPNLAARGARAVNPRWRPNLHLCVDEVSYNNLHVGAPARTYKDWSPNDWVIQCTTDADWEINFDGFGPHLRNKSGGSSGATSVSALGTNFTPSVGLSMSCWARFDTLGNYHVVVGEGSGGTLADYILVDNTGTAYFRTHDGGTFHQTTFSGLVTGVWYHFGYVWRVGGELRAYVNGAEIGSVTAAGTPGNANGSIFMLPGGDVASTQPARSRYPIVWKDRVLTASDMYELYRNPSPFAESPLDHNILNIAYGLFTPSHADGGPYIKVRHGGTGHGKGVVRVTADYALGYSDDIVEVDTSSANISIYLPPAAPRIHGQRFVVKKIASANSVYIYTSDSANIDGGFPVVLTSQWSGKEFYSTDSAWGISASF